MKLKRNIPLIYVISGLMWGRFFIPVLALFYIASQVSLDKFAIIMSVFSLSILLLEIPTGALADLLGRKKTLLLARLMYVIEIILIAFFNGFWIFLIAKVISGVGVSLSSGTSQAITYDTLKKQKRENQYKKISGNIGVVTNISMAIVFIIGAYLFSISPKLPAIVSLPFIVLGFLLTFFLEEPYRSKMKASFKNHWKQIKEGFVYFKKLNFVKYLAIMSLFTSVAISITLSMSSVYFERILIPISLIGALAFIASLLTAFTAKKADKWENKLGEGKSIFIIQILIILGLFLISFMIPYFGYLCYLIIPFVAGFNGVVVGNYMNKHVKSSHRATTLSIANMFGNLGIFILFPFIGHLDKIKGFSFSFIIFGLIILVGFILLYIYKLKLKLKFNS